MQEVAFLITVIAGVGLLFALALIDVHGCRGIWGWGGPCGCSAEGVALGSAKLTALAWRTPLELIYIVNNCFPAGQSQREGGLRVHLSVGGVHNVHVLEGCFIETGPSSEHLKTGCLFLCHHTQ